MRLMLSCWRKRIMCRFISSLFVAFVFFLPSSEALAQKKYIFTAISTLGSGTENSAEAINKSGIVAGSSFTSGSNPTTTHPFRFTNGVLENLGTLGGDFAEAFGINDGGKVVGYSVVDNVTGLQDAFIYNNGSMRSLGRLPNDTRSVATAINNSDEIVGTSYHISGEVKVNHAFIHRDGQMLPIFSSSFVSEALDINDRGQAVGYVAGPGLPCRRAFLHTNGTTKDLGTLPNTECSEAQAINDHGHVAGISYSNSDTDTVRMFFYDGVMHDLGRIGNLGSFVSAMNNAAQIVGASNERSRVGQANHAFIYSDGTFTDLNTFMTDVPNTLLVVANDINDAGQIVGYSNIGNTFERHAFLLTPAVPALLTETSSPRAIALNAVNQVAGPFTVSTAINLSDDHGTRVVFFARGLVLAPGETIDILTVQAEDAQNGMHTLPIEFVGKVPQHDWLDQVVVRLPPDLDGAGELQISFSLRGVMSNKGSITIAAASSAPSSAKP